MTMMMMIVKDGVCPLPYQRGQERVLNYCTSVARCQKQQQQLGIEACGGTTKSDDGCDLYRTSIDVIPC